MLGSRPHQFSAAATPQDRIFSIKRAGRTYWRWERRDASGSILAASEELFMDYVTCFCDARRRLD